MDHRTITDRKIAFLGSGIIAGVFIERLLKAAVTSPDHIIATDPREDRLEELKKHFGIRVHIGNKEGADFGDIIVLAMPPGAVKAVLSESCQAVHEKQIVISLAAAVPTWLIESVLCKPVPVVRVIPNTPSLIGEGMNPYCLGKHVPETALPLIQSFLDVFGKSLRVEERLMNAATALTAVGPTYVFPVIKVLTDAAAAKGLSQQEALQATAQTVLGAAKLVLETGKDPNELKLMIGTRTIDEEGAAAMFKTSFDTAFVKIAAAEKKLTE